MYTTPTRTTTNCGSNYQVFISIAIQHNISEWHNNTLTKHYQRRKMYSNTSNSYWKERQNKTNRSPLLAATLVVIALVAGTLLHRRYSTASLYNNDLLTQRRTIQQTTDEHWKQCESQVNSKTECTTICQPERNSIQRNTMYQACLQESPR